MSNKVRKYRREQEMSQAELAQRAGVSRLTVSNIERGENNSPTLATAIKIATALGHDTSDVFDTQLVN